MSFVTAACVIAFQAWQQIKTYPQRKLNHQRETGAYPKKLEDYNYKKRHLDKRFFQLLALLMTGSAN